MSSTALTAASDLLVVGGAIAITAAGLKISAPFRTSLGTEDDDDSLLASVVGEKQTVPATKRLAPVKKAAAVDAVKDIVQVSVAEVPITPPLTEVKGDTLFAAPAA